MIKVIGDLHFGSRRNSGVFHEILMNELNWIINETQKSDSIVILGDVFDSRSSVDFQILNDALDIFEKLSKKSKEIYILVGNHDLYYKENKTQNVNCRFLQSKKINVINEISSIKIQNKNCLFIPWIDSIERKECAVEALKQPHDVVFGHLDTVGLYNVKNIDTTLMMNNEDLGESLILSGHFHKRSVNSKVNYVGALINQSFNDVGDVKGYHTINKNNELHFIEGSSPRFEYITIPNTSAFLVGYNAASEKDKTIIENKVKGNIVKLMLNEYGDDNDEVYRIFRDMKPLEISISYSPIQLDEEVDTEDFKGFDVKSDIMDIISKYIERVKDKLPQSIDVQDVLGLISEKHNEFQFSRS